MSMPNEHIIQFSKKKRWLALCYLLFPLLPCFTILFYPKLLFAGNTAPSILYGLAVLLVLLCVSGSAWLIYKSYDATPALIINTQGINYHPSDAEHGFIAWGEVCGFTSMIVNDLPIMIIRLKSPHKHLQRGNYFTRQAKQLNFNWFASPIVISNKIFEIDFDRMLQISQQYFHDYQTRHDSAHDRYETLAAHWDSNGRPKDHLLTGWSLLSLQSWFQSSGARSDGKSAVLEDYLDNSLLNKDSRYKDLFSSREICPRCGETYRLENLLICTHCHSTYCHRCMSEEEVLKNGNIPCPCGGELVG